MIHVIINVNITLRFSALAYNTKITDMCELGRETYSFLNSSTQEATRIDDNPKRLNNAIASSP